VSSRADNASPFHVVVGLRVCKCRGPEDLLSKHKVYDRAVMVADGYWQVYLAFFGHLVNIVQFSIVDARDGAVLWRNGRHTRQGGQHAA
jgi:hypothetical protein